MKTGDRDINKNIDVGFFIKILKEIVYSSGQ